MDDPNAFENEVAPPHRDADPQLDTATQLVGQGDFQLTAQGWCEPQRTALARISHPEAAPAQLSELHGHAAIQRHIGCAAHARPRRIAPRRQAKLRGDAPQVEVAADAGPLIERSLTAHQIGATQLRDEGVASQAKAGGEPQRRSGSCADVEPCMQCERPPQRRRRSGCWAAG